MGGRVFSVIYVVNMLPACDFFLACVMELCN